MKELQTSILECLIGKKELTAYGIRKITKKSVPSIEYAIMGLVDSGVVIAKHDGRKTTYSAHPLFYNDKAMAEVGEEIIKVLKIIEKSGEAPTAQGYLDVLSIILAHVEIQNGQDDKKDSS
ncbi:hypothetical protein LCGC14_0926600 [marine sediment metagenome]|uniref:Transcription regulator TrmB N-terminal domain-containing protein n=1 Tax=marine sediment metagenome TaxID=412755 RepID=A0A0F9RVW9_9ZZZZ